MPKVIAAKVVGQRQTYDLEVDHPDHQFFLANGVLTSNSHAMSYAIDSYYCAWLQTYYEAEWLCAYLETTSSSADKLAKAIAEVKSLGWSIAQLDINHAAMQWSILDDKKAFVPSFRGCKRVGDTAIQEIMENRPYRTVEDMLWHPVTKEWRHSKANKRVFEALIQVGAFESMDIVGPGKRFSSYRQMHHVLIENADELKKTPKRDPEYGRRMLRELTEQTQDMPDWTRGEKIEMQKDLLGDVSIETMVPPKVLKKLRDKQYKAIDTYDEQDLYWFVAEEVTSKRTKNKKPYLLIKALGEGSKRAKLFVWGFDPAKHALPEPYDVCLAEVEKSDFGFACQAWKFKVLRLDASPAKEEGVEN
jgi:DNA polymerase III alpha subunit